MINDFVKSISSILYERVTSPLYGTFIIAWSIWNWKILYLSIFISEKSLTITKLDYITTYCYDWKILILYPILSTIILISFFPFLGNAAFYINLKFNQWKIQKKNEIENNQLLTIKQSIAIREELFNQSDKFAKIIEDKNEEIKVLNAMIEKNKVIKNPKPEKQPTTEKKISQTELDEMIKDERIKKYMPIIFGCASRVVSIPQVDYEKNDCLFAIEYFVSSGFIERNVKAARLFTLTANGNKLYQLYLQKQIK